MKFKKIFQLIVSALLLFMNISCNVNDNLIGATTEIEDNSVLSASPDSRFFGYYSKTYYHDEDGISSTYYSYEFFNNNKIYFYKAEYIYNFYFDREAFHYEWKKEGNIYYKRLWNNKFSDWQVFDLEYINEKQIRIGNGVYNNYSD